VAEVEEVRDGVFRVKARRPGSHSYLLRGDDKDVLVDPGMSGGVEELEAALGEVGVSGDGVDMVLNTHEHFDHIGGNKMFQGSTVVAAHRYSAVKMVAGDDEVLRCRANAQDVSGHRVHVWLENNALIDLGGKRLKVLHTPGHTSGSLCIYDTSTRVLVTGDTVFASGTVSGIYESGSQGEYANSLRRLLNFKVDVVCPGHGWVSEEPERGHRGSG